MVEPLRHLGDTWLVHWLLRLLCRLGRCNVSCRGRRDHMQGVNEYGTPISLHFCNKCGAPFTVCPAVKPERLDQWNDCLGDECPSYDIDRDPTCLFSGGPDA